MAELNNTKTLLVALKGKDGVGNKIRCGSSIPSSFDGWLEGDLFILTSTNEYYSFNGTSLDKEGTLGGNSGEKLNVNLDCDHEYEITGKTGHEYAVAVPDGQVLVKRINGQTRRKSLNLLKLNYADVPNLTMTENEDGSITLNGTGGCSLIFAKTIYAGKQISFYLEKVSGSVSIDSADNAQSGMAFNNQWLPENTVQNGTTFQNLTSIWVHAKATYTNYRFKLMVVEGTYTADTMPPFEPYDDNLVNSKCNLKSTSRNLLKITEQGQLSLFGVNITIDADTITMNGTATSSNNFLISTQGFYINGTYLLKAFIEQGSVSGIPSIWLLAEDGRNTAFGINGVGQSYSINYKVKEIRIGFTQGDVFNNVKFKPMLVYGSTAPTEYEPYEESSMLVDKELGEYDYIDNVGHLLVKQTSEVITLDGSDDEGWSVAPYTAQGNSVFIRNLPDVDQTYINIPLVCNNVPVISVEDGDTGNSVGLNISYDLRYYGTGLSDLNSFKTFLSQNPIKIVYKKQTLTTETIQLEAGYQVWNSGLQIQETETIPYVLEKEYAVSLYSQILAITSIVNSIPDDVASKSWVETYLPSDIATQSWTEDNYLKKDDFVIATSGNGNIYKHNLELESEDKQTRILITLINKTSTAITSIIDIASHFSDIKYGGRFPASGLFKENDVSYLVYYIRDVGGVILNVGVVSFTGGVRTEKDVNNVTINDRVETLLVASTE